MSRVVVRLVALVALFALSLGFPVTATTSAQAIGGISIQGGPIPFGPPRDTPQPTGHSSIRGRIVDAESGQAIRRAMVRVSSPSPQVTHSALTDANGQYEFHDLPAGRYSINANKTTFVPWSYGQTQPSSPGKPLVLAENQAGDNVDVRLTKGAVITGHITDDFGDPTPGAVVTLMRQQFIQGQKRLTQTGARATTNDIGEFRLFGVVPGQYFVSANENNVNGNVEGNEARTGYAPTFYPGTPDIAAAQRLAVGMAQTINEINIRLSSTPLATVSGAAVDAKGMPLTRAFVSVQRRGGMASLGGNAGAQTKADGTFSIPNVAPGEYTVRANTPPNGPPAPPTPGSPPQLPQFSVATVTVNGADVTGLLLAPVTPVSVKGRVTFDDTAAAQSVKASSIRVIAQQLSQDAIGPSGPPAQVQDDFTFEVKVPPGPIAFRIAISGNMPEIPVTTSTAAGTAPPPWRTKTVRSNATDITDTGIEVGAQGLNNVEIELTNQLNQVSGAVTDGRGNPVKDFVVILFSQDPARWTSAVNTHSSLVRPGDDGRFKIGTLAPGQYYAIALDRVDPNAWQDPDFLDGLSRQATRFQLVPGDNRTVDLRLFSVQ